MNTQISGVEFKNASPDTVDVALLCENIAKTFNEFRETHDREIAELKKGSVDVVTADKLARIDAGLNQLTELKETVERKMSARLDAMEAKTARAMFGADIDTDRKKAAAEVKAYNAALAAHAIEKGRQVPAELSAEQYAAVKSAFNAYMRKGERSLQDAEFKALAISGNPDGGYLVPADTTGRIIARQFETSPMREDAAVQIISSDALEGVYDLQSGVSGGWVSEKAARPETNTPQLGTWRIEAAAQYANPAITQRLLDDAVIDIEGWLAAKTADILGRTENTAFVSGDGSGKPRGFTTYTTAATADATRAWGQLQHVNTGVNGAFATTGPLDVLLDVVGQFKPKYINANTKWYATREAITAVRKARDGQGQYLWQPGVQLGQPQTLLTFAVRLYQDMPALATGSLSMALADMSQAYQIVQRSGLTTLRDPYTNKPYVHFYTVGRVGGAVVDFEALKFVRFAA